MVKLFDEIPRIENDRIMLRRLCPEDADGLRELTGNDRVYRYLPTFLLERQHEDVDTLIDVLYGLCIRERSSLILGIFRKDTMDFCGLGEYYGFKDEIHKTCVGYRLLEREWGKGVASEALGLMTEYLFSRTDIQIITASTMVENRASARVLEKNGFIRTALAVPEDWGYDEPTITDKWFL